MGKGGDAKPVNRTAKSGRRWAMRRHVSGVQRVSGGIRSGGTWCVAWDVVESAGDDTGNDSGIARTILLGASNPSHRH